MRKDKLRVEAQLWMKRAHSNLARAKQEKPEAVVWEDMCFDAQQAAEKAVKAVLVLRDVDFPKSHDIGDLLALLPVTDRSDPIAAASVLTDYAVDTRYPGPLSPVSEADYRHAVALAERVVTWAEGLLRN